MVLSKEVLSYLKNNLSEKYYVSMFVAGSLPQMLGPQTDLDIFVVMNDKYRSKFFENLKYIMDKFAEKHNDITYTFYRGPLKYKYKGLIHFIIYTDVITKEGVAFKQELLQILSKFRKNAKLICGKSISEITKNVNFEDMAKKRAHKDNVLKKYNLFKKSNIVVYKKWMKINNRWVLRKVWKKPSKFLAEYLKKYYQKNLQAK